MKTVHTAMAKAWLGYVALRLGRAGVAGVLLLAGCGLALAWQGLVEGNDSTAQRIVQLRQDLQRAPAAGKPAATAQSFLAELPVAEQVPQFIEAVHRKASQSGLQIERAEYRAPTLAAGQVLRSQVVLPLTGTYPAIGRWLGQVLRQHPSAAIDELSLQREAAGSDQVRARVVLSHYSRVAP